MQIFDIVCRRIGLEYWLDFGTLLGAVRHGGFIPWDDDSDISMTREHYRQFLKEAPGLLPPDVFMQTMETDPYYTSYRVELRLRDRNSTMIKDPSARYHQGIFIDIFPYDKVPCNLFFRNVQQRLYKIFIVGSYQNLILDKPWWLDERAIRKKVLSALYLIVPRKAVEKSILHLYKLVRQWGLRPTLATHLDNHCFEVGKIFPLREITFEGKTFLAPHDAKSHLSVLYRDWRTLPPEEKRVPSHYIKAEPCTPWSPATCSSDRKTQSDLS